MDRGQEKNPISFQLAFSHLELFANRLWRSSVPDKVDFVYGRIWLHTLELAHRWRQTTAADALASIEFSRADSKDPNSTRFCDLLRLDSDKTDERGRRRSQSPSKSGDQQDKGSDPEAGPEERGDGENSGGNESDSLSSPANRLDENPAKPGSHHEIQTKYIGMLSNLRSVEMVKTSSDDPTKQYSLHLGQILKGGSATAAKCLENYRLTTSRRNFSINTKDSCESQLSCSEFFVGRGESRDGDGAADRRGKMIRDFSPSSSVPPPPADLTAAFERFVSGYRLFLVGLTCAPSSIRIDGEDGHLSPGFRYAEPGCLGHADVLSLVRIPIDVSGADDGFLRMLSAIQRDEVRLLWLPPSSDSSASPPAPPLSYRPPPQTDQLRSNPGPIRRPLVVPWRLRHKNAYADRQRSGDRGGQDGGLLSLNIMDVRRTCRRKTADQIQSTSPTRTSETKDAALGPEGRGASALVALLTPQPAGPGCPEVGEAKVMEYFRNTFGVASAMSSSSSSSSSSNSRSNCFQKRRTLISGQEKNWSRSMMSTKGGRLWDDNDLLVTESCSKDLDELVTSRHKQFNRRSHSDPDLSSLHCREKWRTCKTGTQYCVTGKQPQRNGDLSLNRESTLSSAVRIAWCPSLGGRNGDAASDYCLETVKEFDQKPDKTEVRFEELGVLSSHAHEDIPTSCSPVSGSNYLFSRKDSAFDARLSQVIGLGPGGGIPVLRVIASPSVLPRTTLLPNQYFAMSAGGAPPSGGGPPALPGPPEAVIWPKSKLLLLQTSPGSNQGRSAAAAAGEIQDVCCSGGMVRLNAIHHGGGGGSGGGMRSGVKLVVRPVGSVSGHRPRLVAVQCPVFPLGHHHHHHHHHGVVMQPAGTTTTSTTTAATTTDGPEAGEPNRTSVFRELAASRSSMFPHRLDAAGVPAAAGGAVPPGTVGQLVPYPSCGHRYSLLDCCCCCCCDEQSSSGWRPVEVSAMRQAPLPGVFYGQCPDERRTSESSSSSSSFHHHHHHPHHPVNTPQPAKNKNKAPAVNGGVTVNPAAFLSILGPSSTSSETSGVLIPFPSAYHPHLTAANFPGSGPGTGGDEGPVPPPQPPQPQPKEPKSPPGGPCSGLNVDALPFISHNSTVGVCMYHDWFSTTSDPTFQVLGTK